MIDWDNEPDEVTEEQRRAYREWLQEKAAIEREELNKELPKKGSEIELDRLSTKDE